MPDEAAPALARLAREVADLRPLGPAAARTLQLTEGAQFSAHDLAQVIGTDTAMTAKLLRLANSAYYGFPRRISTVRDAVVLLGFREVRSTVIASSVMDSMSGTGVLDARTFWHFSVTVGMLAEALARADRVHQGEAFTAGVLHDVGRLALDQHAPDLLRRVIGVAERENVPLPEAERAVLGYSSADLGAALTEQWNFPPALIDAVRWHDSRVEDLPDPRSLAAQVIRAREFAQSYGLGDGIVLRPPAPPAEGASIPELAAILERSGGFEGVSERVDAFLEHSLAA